MKFLPLVFIIFLAACASVEKSAPVVAADIEPQYLPVDTDLDGVLDENDECYKTPVGVRVDEIGCPVIEKNLQELLLKINFAYDSAIIDPEFYSEVEQVAIFMRNNPTTRVIIEGHTDSDGSASYNKGLSKKRAQSAAKMLVERFDIASVRVTAIGFGEERPLVENNTAENKAINRRVVAVIRTLKEIRG